MGWSAANAILILSALSVLTPLVTYLMAVRSDHVDAFLPFISEMGDKAPESTVFTQLIAITTAFALLTIHIRFAYVALYLKAFNVEPVFSRMNLISIYIGYVMCLGLLILGCFQLSNAFYVHLAASCGLFTLGSAFYTLFQTVLSCRLLRLNNSRRAAYLRIAINSLLIVCQYTYLVGLFTSMRCSNSVCEKSWHENCPDGSYRTTGALSEWMVLCLLVAYALTYHDEFLSVNLTASKISVTLNQTGFSSAANT